MKKIVHFRYRKINPNDIEVMKIYRFHGLTYKDIAKLFKVAPSTVQYHLDDNYKKKSLKRSNKYNSKLTKKQIRKDKKYLSNYIMERYRKDDVFRAKFIKSINKYQNKIRDEKRRKVK